MKEVKDDFSDLYEELYAEVEVQASSAINCLPSIDKKNIPDIVGSTVDGKNDVTDDTGSDSEDDLNIVLNNNPTNVDQFPVSDCEDDLNIVLPSATNSNQTGRNFVLPRSSIVDIHESKPWRNPGVDITDFFNFGFNEDKWKRYCKDLQQKGRAIHLKDSSSNECRELKKRPIDQDQNVIEIVAPDSRKDSKYLNAEKISVLNESELYTNYSGKRFSKHQGFKTDQNQNRCVDENEYISEIEFSVEKENERRGRWKREEEEEEEESHFRRSMKDYSFVREHRRRFDFKDEKYKRCFPYNSRSRENWENYGRGRFRYHERSKRRYSSPPIHLHNFVNRSWSSRYASKRRLHCTSPPRYRVYEKHDRHEKYRNQIRSKTFNGKRGYHGRFGTIHEERHVVQCRCKLAKEENRSNRFDRSCNFIRRGNRDQTQRSSDNLVDCDIVFPEEKSAKRCSNGGRRMHEKVESNVGLESKALSDFNEPPTDKVLATEKPKIKDYEKREEWIDKIPVTEQKEALDIEEGQIITEETSESSIDDYISSWFRDPMSVDEQSAGLGTTSDLWMI